jgi:DNA repair exonuclease SbcCD ATPase subunit
MQKYALRKVITPSEREQIDSKQWKKDNTKQSYLPSKSYSRAGESSKTILNNNVRNRNNSFSKQNKSMLQSPSYNTSKHDEPQAKENDETEESKSKKDLTLERYRKLLAKYESKALDDNNMYMNSKDLSVESLEEKPFNSTEGNTEIKEKVKLVSTVNDKFTEINKNETSHSIEQINDKTKTLSTISQNSESALSTTDSISSSRQLSMISTASKASLTPSFSTLDELQAKLQSTLEDGDRILEENELEYLKQENKQLNIDLEKMAEDNENLQEQLASYAQLEKEFNECMIRLKKMTMVVNAKEKEVQELTQEREKNKNIIYRMRERTTDLVTKNNELFNSKLKLKYELEFIKEQMEVKTQELEKVIKERNIAEKQVNELRNELNQVKKENENNENDEKKHYWGFRPFGF